MEIREAKVEWGNKHYMSAYQLFDETEVYFKENKLNPKLFVIKTISKERLVNNGIDVLNQLLSINGVQFFIGTPLLCQMPTWKILTEFCIYCADNKFEGING